MEIIMTSIRAKAVIGAGYGDEGKGLITDLLAAATSDSVVVRSNGGAQAGHTVVAPDGRRHVFHHIGSGTMAGAPTHLSTHFVAHPMMLAEEWQALQDMGAQPTVSSDPRVAITTPFDMMINQALELARGGGKHGSCGLGFGETIERNLRTDFSLTMQDLFRPGLAGRLHRMWSDWVPERLARLGIERLPESIMGGLEIDTVITRFMHDCEVHLDRVTLWPDRRIVEKGQVIFEAAQGLMLDQDFGAFPHVTRSNTGLANMLSIASEAGIDVIDAVYATRCYTTRHGAGPLAHETGSLDGIAVDDPTNAPNAWQGTLRLAPLDTAILREAIAHDLGRAAGQATTVDACIAVTCLDQAKSPFAVRDGGAVLSLNPEDAGRRIAGRTGLPLFGESWSSCRTGFRPGDTLNGLSRILQRSEGTEAGLIRYSLG
jgi:adenylosuccinate synthase